MSVEELIEEVEVEFEYIETVLEELKKLFMKPLDYEPELIEITGAGGLLHNFYNGIENIFIRILKSKNMKQEESKDWHKELLKKFYDEGSNVSFLESHIYENFLEILKFRHFFIHSYGFLLQWELLKPLVKKALESYPKFKILCSSFCERLINHSEKEGYS